MHVPFLNLKAQYLSIQPDIDAAISAVMESQQFILGEEVEICEKNIAAYSGATHGCGVSSGTDALLITLMAEGIGAGDEVITTPYTFFATAGSISRTGASPVFADIDGQTCNINPQDIKSRITKNTKAILVVHLYGQMADMDPIIAIAKDHNLIVIEDAAQAIGAEYKGKRAGSIGDYGCFSFFPSKNLGAAGDGGMVITSDEKKAQRLKVFRGHGAAKKYFHEDVGGNFRLDALQAAIVSAKLPYLDGWIEARQKNATQYNLLLSSMDQVTVPEVQMQRHTFNSFVVRAADRDALRNYLTNKEIDTQTYYPLSLHLQKCFASLGYTEGDFPISELASKETLALPIYPEITTGMQEYVTQCIHDFYKSYAS